MWTESFDVACVDEVRVIAAVDRSRAERVAAWRRLLSRIVPEVEAWTTHHPTLARFGMANADDARTVVVIVLERMAANEWENLGNFLSRSPAPLDALSTLVHLDDAAPAADTPFRAWLRVLLGYALGDHLRERRGYGQGADRRRLGSLAERLSDAPEASHRPAMTDWLTLQERLGAVDEAIRALPEPMAQGVRQWAAGDDAAAIADALALPDAEAARRLVRAGLARLRYALRDLQG